MNIGTTYTLYPDGSKRLIRIQAFKSDKIHYDIRVCDKPDALVITTCEDMSDKYHYRVDTYAFKSNIGRINFIDSLLNRKDVIFDNCRGFTVYSGESWSTRKLN